MSIYRRNDLMYSKDVDRDAKRREVSAPSPATPACDELTDWSRHRKARPAEQLLPMADRWFDSLPSEVRPCALLTYYPRIANLMALQWSNRSACPAYFHSLLTDVRGGRQGFPNAVHRDLMQLRDYWYTL